MGGYMRRRKSTVNPLFFVPVSFFLCLMIVSCVKEYPPFDEYQKVGYAPIDTVSIGRLFLFGNRLYTLYGTSYDEQWHLLREYDLSGSLDPQLICIEELTPLPRTYYLNYQDTLVFSQSYYPYNSLVIFNLKTRESYFLDLDFSVYGIAYAQQHTFVSGYGGFRVFDISALPTYVEIFNDSVAHYAGVVALRDTVLLEIYRESGYRFKFWNVVEPTQPQVISEGDLPNQPNTIYSIGLTEHFVICFTNTAISRYRYNMTDSLVYEDVLYLNFNYYHQNVSDSIIYIAGYSQIGAIQIDDFTTQHIWISDAYDERILSMEVLDERIYVLIRNKGIQVYERREP